MKNREEIIQTIKGLKDNIELNYRARVKALFGSYARGSHGENSDLDILVEFDDDANLIHLIGLSQYLEEKLHMPVDIIAIDTLRDEIRDNVLKEAIPL